MAMSMAVRAGTAAMPPFPAGEASTFFSDTSLDCCADRSGMFLNAASALSVSVSELSDTDVMDVWMAAASVAEAITE